MVQDVDQLEREELLAALAVSAAGLGDDPEAIRLLIALARKMARPLHLQFPQEPT